MPLLELHSTNHARRGGAAAVELAIFLPLILSLLFCLGEVAHILDVQRVLHLACQEGAREAATGDVEIQVVANRVLNVLHHSAPDALDLAPETPIFFTRSESVRNVVTVVVSQASREVCPIRYQNVTHPAQSDPINASQSDKFMLSVSLPRRQIKNAPGMNLALVTGEPLWTATVFGSCLNDFTIPHVGYGGMPAQ